VARIEFGEIVSAFVLPAQVQERTDADDHAEGFPMLDGEVVRCETTHRTAGKNVCFPLWPDRKMGAHEIEDVIEHEVRKIAGTGVEEEATRATGARLTGQGAVRGGDDQRRQLAVENGFINDRGDVMQECFLVLAETMQPDHEWIPMAGVISRRQVNV